MTFLLLFSVLGENQRREDDCQREMQKELGYLMTLTLKMTTTQM